MIEPSRRAPRPWHRPVLLIALLAVLVVPMAGCGKKSPLDPPPGTEDTSTYPRQYPTQ